MTRALRIATVLTVAAFVAMAPSARAQQPPRDAADDVETAQSKAANIGQQSIGSILPEPLATWNGLRTLLAERGLSFAFTYQSDPFNNFSGGLRTGATYMGRLQATADFNPEKLTGWEGAQFHASMYQIHGVGLSQHFIGSLGPVSDLEAVATTRLYEAWVEQKLGPYFSLRVGQLAADTEFWLSPYMGLAIGGTFGWPLAMSANLPSGGQGYPFASPGFRLKITPTEQITLLAALFDGDPAGPGSDNPQYRNLYGLNWRMRDPPLLMGEAHLKYGSFENGPIPPGNLKLGAWTHLGRFADQRIAANFVPMSDPSSVGQPLQRRTNFGIYGVIDQQIFQRADKKDEGIYAVARAAFSPADRNLVQYYIDGGIYFTGMVPDRPDDLFGFYASWARVSSGARGADFDLNLYNSTFAPVRNYEAILEATYSFRVAPGFLVQPVVEYVIHPGGGAPSPGDPLGLRRIRNAFVAGVRTTIQY